MLTNTAEEEDRSRKQIAKPGNEEGKERVECSFKVDSVKAALYRHIHHLFLPLTEVTNNQFEAMIAGKRTQTVTGVVVLHTCEEHVRSNKQWELRNAKTDSSKKLKNWKWFWSQIIKRYCQENCQRNKLNRKSWIVEIQANVTQKIVLCCTNRWFHNRLKVFEECKNSETWSEWQESYGKNDEESQNQSREHSSRVRDRENGNTHHGFVPVQKRGQSMITRKLA